MLAAVGDDEAENGVRLMMILAGKVAVRVFILPLSATELWRGEPEGEDEVGDELEEDAPSSFKCEDGRIGKEDDLKNRPRIDDDAPTVWDVENPTAVELELRLEIAWVLVLELELETLQTGDTGGD